MSLDTTVWVAVYDVRPLTLGDTLNTIPLHTTDGTSTSSDVVSAMVNVFPASAKVGVGLVEDKVKVPVGGMVSVTQTSNEQ